MFKKKDKKMGDLESQAKKSVLEDLRDTAKKAMSGKLNLLNKKPDGSFGSAEKDAEPDKGEDGGDLHSMENAEKIIAEDQADKSYEDCSAEELEEEIQKLQALKAKKLSPKDE